MKKFNDANVGLFILLTTCLSLFSCNNDNDNYPKDYVGFEKSTRTVECDKNQSESELQIKIIATDKSKEDRTVLLATPALPAKPKSPSRRDRNRQRPPLSYIPKRWY